MDQVIRLSYSYHDIDAVEIHASAWNGNFGGSTLLWVAQGQLAEIADAISGFPANVGDIREVTLGAFGPQFAGGAMSLSFSCIDLAGHCNVMIIIEAEFGKSSATERAEILGRFEPAAVDRFVEELRALNAVLRGSASLDLT